MIAEQRVLALRRDELVLAVTPERDAFGASTAGALDQALSESFVSFRFRLGAFRQGRSLSSR